MAAATAQGDSFWDEIDHLTTKLQRENRTKQTVNPGSHIGGIKDAPYKQTTRSEVIKKIEFFIEGLLTKLAQNNLPDIQFKNRRSWANMSFIDDVGVEMNGNATETTIKLNSNYSIQKYAKTLKILRIAHGLLQENVYSTKREIYYNDVPFFGNQATVDHIVDDISCMFNLPRHALHILACSKGYVSGKLSFREHDGNLIDCNVNPNGILIPTHIHGIYNICSDAKAILVVEKDATYQRLLDDDILEKLYPIIMITGKGFPDLNTRVLVKRLWESLEIPVLALVDTDPHGVEIMCVYRFGSMSQSYDTDNLAVPSMRWIGVLPSDLERLSINKEAQIPLTEQDRKKISQLLDRPYVKAHASIQQELLVLLNTGHKAEMQALSTISTGFITDVFLPIKIKHGKWI
ncbi:meiotic recombination protein SPO11-like [Dendronephthya gigantea]|uniref:meiotic recombination protein SPO11-like n=1 Tax=Dendronephthya gigantea TaxID=151771 RepID=UPI00106CC80A|nr:meiotic recombination protein SPO11-like [Dendronephthya gigantea]